MEASLQPEERAVAAAVNDSIATAEPAAALPAEPRAEAPAEAPAASRNDATTEPTTDAAAILAAESTSATASTATPDSAAPMPPDARDVATSPSPSSASSANSSDAADATSATDASASPAAAPSESAPAAPPALPGAPESNGNRWSFASRALRAAKKLLTTELTLYPSEQMRPLDERPQPGGALRASADEVSTTTRGDAAASDDHDESAAAQPALCGHSSVLAVPEVLGLLANLHKSGAFAVWNGVCAYRIHLVRGTVVSAQALAQNHSLMLGRILVDQGSLPESTLTAFLEAHPSERRRLGAALVEAGLIDRVALDHAIAYQAQRVFHAAYDLRDAWYRFDVAVGDTPYEHGLSVTHLLLESARLRDETEQRLHAVFDDPFASNGESER